MILHSLKCNIIINLRIIIYGMCTGCNKELNIIEEKKIKKKTNTEKYSLYLVFFTHWNQGHASQ